MLGRKEIHPLLVMILVLPSVGSPAASALASRDARPISPGSTEQAPSTGRCPTFSWSEVPEAAGYEIAIEAAPSRPVLRMGFPAGTLSWTPEAASCLPAGTRYLWRVRTRGATATGSASGSWSRPLAFRVEPEHPSTRRLADLLAGGGGDELSPARRAELVDLGWLAPESPASSASGPLAPSALAIVSATEPFRAPTGTAAIELDNLDDFAVWARSQGISVWGESAAATGSGIRGDIDFGEVTVSTVAVEGLSDALAGVGVIGEATLDPGNNSSSPKGVRGESLDGTGVHGLAISDNGPTVGVQGESASPKGHGLCGQALNPGTVVGVRGESLSSEGWDFYADGVGMDYGPFTGTHEVRLDPASSWPEPGQVVSLSGDASTRLLADGTVDVSSTLPTVTLSSHDADPRVFGVFVGELELPGDHWLADRTGRFALVNALGEGRVWVTDRNGEVGAGDYVTSSAVPGFAQRQSDPVLRPQTLAKVIEEIDWSSVATMVTHDGQTYRTALVAVIYASG